MIHHVCGNVTKNSCIIKTGQLLQLSDAQLVIIVVYSSAAKPFVLLFVIVKLFEEKYRPVRWKKAPALLPALLNGEYMVPKALLSGDSAALWVDITNLPPMSMITISTA